MTMAASMASSCLLLVVCSFLCVSSASVVHLEAPRFELEAPVHGMTCMTHMLELAGIGGARGREIEAQLASASFPAERLFTVRRRPLRTLGVGYGFERNMIVRYYRKRICPFGFCLESTRDVCRDRGTCQLNRESRTYACACDAGTAWTGAFCQQRNECESNGVPLCVNGGTCRVTADNRPMCQCPAGFSGRVCQDIIDEEMGEAVATTSQTEVIPAEPTAATAAAEPTAAAEIEVKVETAAAPSAGVHLPGNISRVAVAELVKQLQERGVGLARHFENMFGEK
eukprot:scpid88055/ scgid13331/ Probable cubilin